jgi:drug/metabolite transporter (DMT)-like permease
MRIKDDRSGLGALKNVVLGNLLMTLIGLPVIILSIIHGDLPPAHEWLFLVLLGIVPWGVPDVLYTIGIKHVPVFRALIIGLLDPVLTAVWPIFFLGEIPSKMAFVGCAVIVLAIVYQAYYEQKRLRSAACAVVV